MRSTRPLLPLPLAVALACAVGCAREEKGNGKVKVYPVEGKLIVSERPAENARLMFHPANKGAAPLCPVAVTGPDGSFRLTTHAANDGAPEGEYIVTLLWPHDSMPIDECECPDPITHDRLFGLYLDPATSRLRATIRPEHNELTLYATVGGKGWNLPRLQDNGKKPDRPLPGDRDRDRGR